jgi:hypothetical protein
MGRPERHEGLYGVFDRQSAPDKTLHVLDESTQPSAFFTALRDPRVFYRHEPAAPRPAGEPTRIGATRNRLLASLPPGIELVAHFDDDDVYEPDYLTTMAERLGDADLVKLSVWNLLHEGDGTIWQWDTRAMGGQQYAMKGSESPVPVEVPPGGDPMTADWTLWGYGFSYVYRLSLWQRHRFPEQGTEDYPWLCAVRAAGGRLVLVDDVPEICLHTVHPKSESMLFPQRRLAGVHARGAVDARMLGAVGELFALPRGQAVRVQPGAKYVVLASVKDKHSLKEIATRAGSWGVTITGARDHVPAAEFGVPAPAPGYRLVQAMATATRAGAMPWKVPSPLSIFDSSSVVLAWTDTPPMAAPTVHHELGLHRLAGPPRRRLQPMPPRVAAGHELGLGRVGRTGLGGSITDFDSLVANVPEAAQAWQQVASQFASEGGGAPGVVPEAQTNFYNAFQQLTNTLTVLPNTSQGLLQAGKAAAGLVLNSSTLGGAVDNITSLIGAVESGAPAAIVQSFTGVLVSSIGLAVAAGSVSFGIGAAIVVGIEIVASVVSSLFGQSPPAATICGSNLQNKPTYVVGCCWTFGQAVPAGPHSIFWRKFPRPSVANDAWWFKSNGTGGVGDGQPATYWTSGGSTDLWESALVLQRELPGNTSVGRPVDDAFRAYHQLECDLSAVALVGILPDTGGPYPAIDNGIPLVKIASPDDVKFARFVQAYFTAWMANQEYALNGLKPQDDALVLLQLVQFWNSAHDTSSTHAVAPRSLSSGSGDVIGAASPCQGDFQSEYFYVQMLVGDLRHTNASALDSNGNLVINTGAKKNFTLAGKGRTAGGSASSGQSALVTVAEVGAGVLAVGAIGTAIYAWRTHQKFGAVVKKAASWRPHWKKRLRR